MTDLKASLLLYALLCAQVADWITTVYAMSFGAYEANPIMAPLFALSPWVALLPKLAIVAFCTLIWFVARRQTQIANAVLWCFVTSVVASLPPVVWNTYSLWYHGLI